MSVSGTDEDEHGIAQRAVVEGQAMVVFIDYLLRAQGITLANSPDAQNLISNSLDELRRADGPSRRATRTEGKHDVPLSRGARL